MASIKDVPVAKIREVFDSAKDLSKLREETVRVAIFIDPSAPADLVEGLKEAFVPQTSHGLIHVERLSEGVVPGVNPSTDVAVVATGGSDKLVSACAKALVSSGVATAIVAESSLDAPDIDGASSASAPLALITASSRSALFDKLARWVIDVMTKDLAFAANFEFVRRPKAEKIISAAAGENAVIGFVPILPGADMPIMTANQAKMALEIAAVYGQDFSAERIPELLGVVGGGFVMRTAAREAVGLIPGVGWAIKGGVGYAGTVAVGRAIVARFEIGDGDGVKDAAGDVVSGAREAFTSFSDMASKFATSAASQASKTATDAATQAGKAASDIASQASKTAVDVAGKASEGARSVAAEGGKRARDAFDYITIKAGGITDDDGHKA